MGLLNVIPDVRSEPAPPTAVAGVPAHPREAFVEARGVTKRYRSGLVANDAVDLTARRGEVTALVGPNGAGKTTLVMQLVGLAKPTAGSIRVGGIDMVAQPDAAKELIGYQPQTHMAMGGLEVRRALLFTARLRGLSKVAAQAQAVELIDEFDLAGVLDKPLSTLSGGWRRLVDVAVAFSGDPQFVVLDEPTESLDPAHRRLIWRKLDRMRQSRRAACLLVTHNLLEAERVVDHVVMLDRHRVAESGSPGMLKQRFAAHILLDLYLRVDAGAIAMPDGVAGLGRSREVRAGHVQLVLSRKLLPRAMDLLFDDGADRWLEDFRLARPSLETVVLELSRQEP
ncbi:MAG TPA: ABC transporter ATP-binding protein [Solirubrobacteraceae bacterium]|jgi:ABC-type multidrug transport system ATPase subunit|nr:ABC transporter ATP-binding protein [Solirubrobacteraceae bacterium]